MNLPNKLTLLRAGLVPVLALLMYLPGEGWMYAAAAVFALGCLTDYLDGHIARRDALVTDFGRFLDPLADKLLVLTAMVMLLHHGLLPAAVIIVVLARELSVDGLRMAAAGKGQVIAAGKLGKLKTVSQMLLIGWLMLSRSAAFATVFGGILTVWVLVITLWSGVDYFIRNKHVIDTH